MRIAEGLYLSTSPDLLRRLLEPSPPRARLMIGYSGWGPGQLEAELEREVVGSGAMAGVLVTRAEGRGFAAAPVVTRDSPRGATRNGTRSAYRPAPPVVGVATTAPRMEPLCCS